MSFLQRYIYVADILAHEIHVLEKQHNMNLTQVKVKYFFLYIKSTLIYFEITQLYYAVGMPHLEQTRMPVLLFWVFKYHRGITGQVSYEQRWPGSDMSPDAFQ